jgi:hypothetical protein
LRTSYDASVGDNSTEIRHFGNTARIIDAGGVLDHLIGDHLAAFVKGVNTQTRAGNYANLELLSDCLVQFMRTGMARDVIRTAYPGDPGTKAICQALHQSVSEDNIATLTTSVTVALKRMRARHMVNGTLCALGLPPLVAYLLAYLGNATAMNATAWGVALAAAIMFIARTMLANRIERIIPAANVANLQDHGDAAVNGTGNPLLDFARSKGLLISKTVFIITLAVVAYLAIKSGEAGELKFREFSASTFLKKTSN